MANFIKRFLFFYQAYLTGQGNVFRFLLIATTILAAIFESVSLGLIVPVLMSMLSGVKGLADSSIVAFFSQGVESLFGFSPTTSDLLLLGVLLITLKAVLTYLSLSLAAILRSRILRKSKSALFEGLKYVNPSNVLLTKYSEGDFFSLFSEHTNKFVTGFHYFVMMVVMLLSGLVYAACLLFLLPQFAAVALIIIVLAFLPYGLLTQYARRLSKVRLKFSGMLTSDVMQVYRAREYLSGVGRSAVFDEDVAINLNGLVSGERRAAYAYAASSAVRDVVLLSVIGGSSLIFLSGLGGDPASLVLGFGILYRSMTSFLSSQQNYQKLSEIEASCREVYGIVVDDALNYVVDSRPAAGLRTNNSQKGGCPSVSLRSLSLRFDGVGDVLSDINIDFGAGEISVITGPSGSGKSSLLRCILGVEQRFEGDISFHNKSAGGIERNSLLRIGFVPQYPQIFERSIKWNLTLSNEPLTILEQREIWHVLEKVSLAQFVGTLPDGLDTILNPSEIALSGGQRQRLHLARELYCSSNVLLFDEPTSALDRQNVDNFSELINGLRGMATCIVVTHDSQVARHADLRVNLEGGVLSTSCINGVEG